MAARRSQTITLSSRLGANNDPKNKYSGDGINFKARFVGSEDVMDNTGSKIAQAAIGRIRAACREAGGGKPKVLINLSFNGIKVADLKTKIWSINVPIPRVTYIAKDAEDQCVFCIIVARKKAGFKLFVYKTEQRITAQIVQSVRELFQVVYKMHLKKKKMEETKSKSATTLAKTTSDTAIARITSDSRLLDPPPQYEEEGSDPAYSMVDLPPPPKSQAPPPPKNQGPPPKNQDMVKTKPQEDSNLVDILSDQPVPAPQNNEDVYAVPLSKRKRSSVIPFGYQVPTSNQPALPSNHYQVPSNRPAFPDTTDATQEWSVLDAELAEIARELNMFGGNSSSTPEPPAQQQQQRRLSHKQPSIVDPFQDDFFNQPFNPLQGELFDQPDDSMTFESSDPFSSPDLSVLSGDIGDTNDDPFTAFEFDNNKPTTNGPAINSRKETTSVVPQPLVDTAPPIPPDPLGVRLSFDEPPDETLQQSKISASGNPFNTTETLGATTDKTDKVMPKNWTMFDSDFGAVSTDLNKAKKRSSMFEESFSSKQITNSRPSNASVEQTVSPLQPPPRSRRRSSRPHTVYGEQSIKIDAQSHQPTPKKPLFDLASIKPKTVSKDDDDTSKDPFMDLFMRQPDDNLTNVPSSNNGLEYASTHL